MVIDCDACAVRGPACGDCVVSVLLGGPPVQREDRAAGDLPGSGATVPVELDGAEQAALAVLADCGLVPPLRLVPLDRPAAAPADAPARSGRIQRPQEGAEREVS